MQISSTTPSYQQIATNNTSTQKPNPEVSNTKHPRGSKEHDKEMIHSMLNRDFPKDVANALEEKAEGMEPVEVAIMTFKLKMSIGNYAAGNGAKAHFQVQTDSNGNVVYPDFLSKEQMKDIDFNAFLTEALDNFKSNAAKSSTEVKNAYNELIEDYSQIQEIYNRKKSEPIYA